MAGIRTRNDDPESWKIGAPPRDVNLIIETETALTLPHFTVADAWTLGSALRTRLTHPSITKSTLIDITLSSGVTVFRCATGSGVAPDNESWVARKRTSVQRWGCSTWALHVKYGGDEAAFATKFALGERAGNYAIHGGGWPVRVRGVDGVVAVVVVSGLKQEEDHQVIVETIQEMLQESKQ